MSVVRWQAGQDLASLDLPRGVYFPISGVVSVMVNMDDGRALGTRLIGSEGMGGLFADAMQGAGMSLKAIGFAETVTVPTDMFFRTLGKSAALSRLVADEVARATATYAILAGCNHFHSVEARSARVLLELHDRTGQGPVRITQQLIADVLGVRRGSVTSIMKAFRARDLVAGRRNELAVVDPDGLARFACNCYATLRSLHGTLWPRRETSAAMQAPQYGPSISLAGF